MENCTICYIIKFLSFYIISEYYIFGWATILVVSILNFLLLPFIWLMSILIPFGLLIYYWRAINCEQLRAGEGIPFLILVFIAYTNSEKILKRWLFSVVAQKSIRKILLYTNRNFFLKRWLLHSHEIVSNFHWSVNISCLGASESSLRGFIIRRVRGKGN